VAGWLTYWLEGIIKRHRGPTTYDNYEVLVRLHIQPYLGQMRLDRLQPVDIERWLETLEKRGVGFRTRQSALIRLRTALKAAVLRRKLALNPAEHVEAPRQPRRARRPPPDLAAARALLAALADNRLMRAFVLLWLGVGLRWDEDLKLDEGYLIVQHRVSRTRKQGLLVREGGKTAESNAALVLPGIVVEALRELRQQQRERRLRAGSRWKGTAEGYVFTTGVGTLIEPRNVNRAFDAALRRAGLARRTPHSLRHDFAGLLLAGGVPSRVTQEMMRHTSYGLTANVYQRPPDELQHLGAAVIDQILGPNSGKVC
jgi:integrase